MRSISLFLKLVRWPNLLFILLTQFLFQYCVINPLMLRYSIGPLVELRNFLMIATAYQLIAAAGYIINDYFDVPIDLVNKPHKVFITQGISKRTALALYIAMNVTAILLSISLSNPLPLICVIISIVLLFMYSAFLKKSFLTGNVLVSGITASAVLVLFMMVEQRFRYLQMATLLYTGFAFLLSFAREVIKDLEDIGGDRLHGGQTMAIVLSDAVVRYIVVLNLFCMIILLGVIQPYLWGGNLWTRVLSVYIILLVMIPLIRIILKVFKAKACADYNRLSGSIKIVMLMGILSMLFVQYI
ncbi:hypothetical protein GFS24_04635 [Chitinophaga sp. SYP-B3965]|uniref:geranylgeranylglycerol-phosphate geranylgeranyltransferase n=1 Tax=Chitinophaga sp. SYP-B3965 TaxID=2663120 RepID=UPI00129980C2|nr:geranylgeranylglycerol-phosphate geranylgeranyltransferase [Chitinophaga sp. SYP-B3965]MRG44386.1 hypothetical protein [Chitinophaga sp. SYP-B3965]